MPTDDMDSILGFWIDEIGPSGWYKQDADVDARITREFEELWHRAMADALGDWRATARGALAYLILTDQFPRNMFRGTGRAFASDGRARRAARLAIARNHPRRIAEPQRQFFFIPLMHSESLADQQLAICHFLTAMPETGRRVNLPHSIKHREVIRRFGRFPSRNAALGRPDTAAELVYRAQGGYMG